MLEVYAPGCHGQLDRELRRGDRDQGGRTQAVRAPELGLEVRVGLDADQCQMLDGKVAEIAVSIGARVSAQTAADQVLVPQTVKDFGRHLRNHLRRSRSQKLKGVSGEWRLYSVASAWPSMPWT